MSSEKGTTSDGGSRTDGKVGVEEKKEEMESEFDSDSLSVSSDSDMEDDMRPKQELWAVVTESRARHMA